VNPIKLPDFDDLIKLAEDIGALSKQLIIKKAQRDVLNAEIIAVVTTNNKYWPSGKQPAMNFVEGVYKDVGYDEFTKLKMEALHNEIADVTGLLEGKKNLFLVYRDMVDVWRTESANKRGAYLDG